MIVPRSLHKLRGFTLVELVIAMVLLAVLAVGITSFIGLSTQTYINVTARDELISTARFAVERLNREIRNSVPNSVRVRNYSTAACIDFVPIIASTTYLDAPVSPEPASDLITVIPFKGNDGNDYACSGSCFDNVIIYPLTNADVYSYPNDNVGKMFGLKSVTYDSANQWTLVMDHSSGNLFDADSPTNRLYITKGPTTYCQYNNKLYRFSGFTLDNGSYVFPPVAAVIMAENLVNITSGIEPFKVLPATLQRNALVQLNLQFSLNGENINFNHDIHLANTP